MFPIVPVVAGFAVTVIGLMNWRQGGKRLALSGLTLATMGGSILLRDNPGLVRTAMLTALFVLALLTFVTEDRRAWRSARVELSLLGAAGVTLGASYVLTDISSGAQLVLLVLLAIFAALFLVSVVVRRPGGHARSV